MTAHRPGDPMTTRRLYGRAQGHKLRAGQQELIDDLLPRVAVPDGRPARRRAAVRQRPRRSSSRSASARASISRVRRRRGPSTGFIGCEPFVNGMVGALLHVRDEALENVRLHLGDALDVLERLPDASLERLYLLHPDPWPKARHSKRRMVNDGPLDLIARKLKPGGEFRLGTDDPTYCRWAMMVMNRRRDFQWLAQDAQDFLTRPADWPETRYERKARRKGHEVWYFRYVRT